MNREQQKILESYEREFPAEKLDLVLEPSAIAELVSPLLAKRSELQYEFAERAVSYLNQLIQASYASHHNDFFLPLGGEIVNDLGLELNGTAEEPLRLKITGYSLGDNFLRGSSYISAVVQGNAGDYFASEARFIMPPLSSDGY